MKVIFMGTPDFAVYALKSLVFSRHTVVAAVSQPDKPGNRGKVKPTPVKQYAMENGIPVYQFDNVNTSGAEILRSLNADVAVTAAFGQMLNDDILTMCRFGVINLHGSLLPAYRGASPVQQAILNGDTVTGVTIMRTAKAMDSGDIISSRKIVIGKDETAGELFVRVAEEGAELLRQTLDDIENGTATYTPQCEKSATYVKTLKKSDGLIDWNRDYNSLHNLIRAMTPWPSAYTYHRGEILKVFGIERTDKHSAAQCGSVVGVDNGICVSIADGVVRLKDVQRSGGRRMPSEEYQRGAKLLVGTVLGEHNG